MIESAAHEFRRAAILTLELLFVELIVVCNETWEKLNVILRTVSDNLGRTMIKLNVVAKLSRICARNYVIRSNINRLHKFILLVGRTWQVFVTSCFT